jgi:signal transduction histidine kinase
VVASSGGVATLLAALLVFGRFRRNGATRDVVLSLAILALATSGLGFSALSAVLDGNVPPFAQGLPALVANLLAAALLAGVALEPRLPRHRSWWDIEVLVAVWLTALGVQLTGLTQPISAALFLGAALGFIGGTSARDDALAAGLVVATTLAAFSCLADLVGPRMSAGDLSAGELLRLASSLFLFAGATTGLQRHWKEIGATESRRRVARDLHDGLAQELALIVMQSRSGAIEATSAARLEGVLDSSQRALDEARHMIATLTRPADLSLVETLADEAEEVAQRVGLRLELDLEELDLSAAAQDACSRILRETLGLVASKAGAETAVVRLADEGGTNLRISHDGRALDARRDGRGLLSIEQRARGIGGALTVESRPGGGCILVSLP